MPWRVRLVRSAVISVDNVVETPEFVHFFHVLAGHVLAPADGGHIDLFLPLGSSGQHVFTLASCRLIFDNIVFKIYSDSRW